MPKETPKSDYLTSLVCVFKQMLAPVSVGPVLGAQIEQFSDALGKMPEQAEVSLNIGFNRVMRLSASHSRQRAPRFLQPQPIHRKPSRP